MHKKAHFCKFHLAKMLTFFKWASNKATTQTNTPAFNCWETDFRYSLYSSTQFSPLCSLAKWWIMLLMFFETLTWRGFLASKRHWGHLFLNGIVFWCHCSLALFILEYLNKLVDLPRGWLIMVCCRVLYDSWPD